VAKSVGPPRSVAQSSPEGRAVRATLIAGGVLAVAAVLVVALSASLGLDVESVALMGAATGAVVALVPDGSPAFRLVGFLIGFGAAWVGYLVRAGFLPDSTAGHSVAVAFVVVVCTLGAALSRGRIPLWATLLGAAALAGSYEDKFVAAPSQVLSTSTASSTSVLLAVALGFFAASLVAPAARREQPDAVPEPPEQPDDQTPPAGHRLRLDDMMKEDAR
jgi:hypothetical protein